MAPIIKITKVTKTGSSDLNKLPGIEVEIDIDGETVLECFVDYDYWMEKVDGEERFIKRIRENHLKDEAQKQKEFDDDQSVNTKTKIEITKFKNKEVK